MSRFPETIVVGCGVIGLACALRLQEAGFPVRIISREPPSAVTSMVAGAVWYPYRVEPKERVGPWSRATLETLAALAEEDAAGVAMTTLVELFDRPADDPWWKTAVPSFRRAQTDDLKPGYVDGYVIDVPIVNTPVHLRSLRRRFAARGGSVEVVPEGIDALAALHAPDRLIVNCTGLGARTLCDDEAVYPIRGQVVRVTNPGLTRCWVDDHGPLAMTYILPRGDDCILGGTADAHVWDHTPSDATTEQILHRARTLEPRLRDAEVLEVQVGLRPARTAVRLERENVATRCAVIHNYGHGGAGFTLAWGCADEVCTLAKEFAQQCLST